jgi:hypothetical protein
LRRLSNQALITNRHRRIALYSTAAVGLLLALVALLFVIEQRRAQAEMGPALSALFSEEVLRDADKWAAGRTLQIVIQRRPDCQVCPQGSEVIDVNSWFRRSLRSRGRLVFGEQPWFAQSSRITRASFLLNSLFSTDIGTDVHLPNGARAVFVNPSELGGKPSDFEAKFPNNLGYFIVSPVGLNLNKSEALLYVDHFCSGLCGGGAYVLMRKTNGAWHVADTYGTWVS